jgi:hypothetical protein
MYDEEFLDKVARCDWVNNQLTGYQPCLRNFKITILLVGVLLLSATESMGTKILASGK